MGTRTLLMVASLLLTLVQVPHTTAMPTMISRSEVLPTNKRDIVDSNPNEARALSAKKRDTPPGTPQTCGSDFDCLQSSRPSDWPRQHPTVQSGNYACVFGQSSSPNGGNGTTTGTCQFVVTAGEQCNVANECAAFAFYSQFYLTAPSDLCSSQHCTLESTCGSPWQDSNAPANHSLSNNNNQISCCGGQPAGSICSLVGFNVDSCEYHSNCNFDLNHQPDDPSDHNGYKLGQMGQQGLGVCQPIDQRSNVWIGVVITLISSTVLNLGLNGQKYALRKHDERRIRKELEMEEEHERWRQELSWTEEEVQKEADRLYEEKENMRGQLYRRLKPYMFWRNIFVSKLWGAGLLVFIVGNLGGFIALRFAPQSLTAPLGSISLISNVIIAPLINKEVLGKWDLAGIFFIVAGSVIVVVFSGIVAQDYKLCVLINLFHKPATIVYLTFIGICIVSTFFFIQFVEKNVENEDDVAIGVSSEQQLKQEGRLHWMHSNMSNLSLAANDRHEPSLHGALASTSISTAIATTKGLDPEKGVGPLDGSVDEPLDAPAPPFSQPGNALNLSLSHHTITSDTSDTAVETSSTGGTEHPHDPWRPSFGSSRKSANTTSSIGSSDMNTSPSTANPDATGKQGSRLIFGELLSSPGVSTPANTAAAARARTTAKTKDGVNVTSPRSGGNRPQPIATSSASNNRPVRRRRHKPNSDGSNKREDGTPLTMWERIWRIELIPSLPEDKLIGRNSPLLRFCLPLAYAALGGMMASYTVLFAKSLINLLVASVFDGQNQFTSGLAWVILIVTVVTAVSQVYWINMGLKKYDALLQVPVFFTIWVLLDIVGGGVYYGEFSGFTAKKYVLFCLGVLIVFFGVALLAKRLALLAKEDVGELQADSATASRRESTVNGAAGSR